MVNRFSTCLFASVMALGLASAALAAEPDPGHPRVNEVTKRLDRQADRTNAGVADGQINGKEAARDRRADARVSNQMARDEAKHDGHLTKGEQVHLNKELNADSERIHDQRH
jgi:hypothetical protein